MTYQAALDHDNTGGLADMNPQPASVGIQVPDERYGGGGSVFEDGAPFTEWVYDGLMSADQYAAVLAQLGLTSAKTRAVTINTTDAHSRSFVLRNGTAVRPMVGRDVEYKGGFYRNVHIRIIDLEALS